MTDQLELSDIIVEAVREVFETMIFMGVDSLADYSPEFDSEGICSSIHFKGSLQGRLLFHVDLESAEVIAQNMLGPDMQVEVDHSDIYDAIGEVTNMVMGSIKTRLQNIYSNIMVSVPSIVKERDIQNSFGDQAHQTVARVYLDNEYPADFMLICKDCSQQAAAN